MVDSTPDHGIESANDFFVGESGDAFSYDALSDIDVLHERLQDAFNDITDREPVAGSVVVLTSEERTKLLEFYTVAHSHLERICSMIMNNTIADDSRNPEKSFEFFQDDFSQYQRENLLFWSGIIDSGMKGEMKKIRDIRNELVHEQHKRMYIDLDNKVQSDIGRAYDKIHELDNMANDIMGIDPD